MNLAPVPQDGGELSPAPAGDAQQGTAVTVAGELWAVTVASPAAPRPLSQHPWWPLGVPRGRPGQGARRRQVGPSSGDVRVQADVGVLVAPACPPLRLPHSPLLRTRLPFPSGGSHASSDPPSLLPRPLPDTAGPALWRPWGIQVCPRREGGPSSLEPPSGEGSMPRPLAG